MKKYVLACLLGFFCLLNAFGQEQESNPYTVDFESNYNFEVSVPFYPKCWRMWSQSRRNGPDVAKHGTYYAGSNPIAPQPIIQYNTCFFNAKTTDTFSFYVKIVNLPASGAPFSALKPFVGTYKFGSSGGLYAGVLWVDTIQVVDSDWVRFKYNFPINGMQRVVIYLNKDAPYSNWVQNNNIWWCTDYFRTNATPIYDAKPRVHIKLTTGTPTACTPISRTFTADSLVNWSSPFKLEWFKNRASGAALKTSIDRNDTIYTDATFGPNDTIIACLQSYATCNLGSDLSIYKVYDTIIIGICKKINSLNLPVKSFCPGASITVNYKTSPSGNWTTGTKVLAQYASAKTFATPTNIGLPGNLTVTNENQSIASTLSTSLASGKYYIRCISTDGVASDYIDSITIYPVPVNSAVITGAKCIGDATGSINLSVTAGTTPFTYSWSNGATVQDISSMAAATYTVTTTDQNGCRDNDGYAVGQPPATFSLSLNLRTNVTCFGSSTGSININTSVGTEPYTYSWSNGATDKNVSSLVANTYNITATDNYGCTRIGSWSITEPDSMAFNKSITHVNCYGQSNGSINLTPVGGSGGYVFSWSIGSTTKNIGFLTASTYTLKITDASSCTRTGSFIVTQPSVINISGTTTDVAVFGQSTGAVNITVSGGTGSVYGYAWSNSKTTEDISGLSSGLYTVTASDVNSCNNTMSFTINQPGDIVPTAIRTHVTCNGGTNGNINLSVAGGTTPYTYSWVTGATTQDITGLSSGSYNITISDQAGGSKVTSYSINQPSALNLSRTITNTSCFGGSDGSIDLSVTGGNDPYTYSWSNTKTTQDPTGLTRNTYTITVTDSVACTATASYAVDEPTTLVLTPTATDISCFGRSDGGINISSSGGTSPYTFSWSNGAASQNISSVGIGTYTLTLTDNKACTKIASSTLTQPSKFNAITSDDTISCANNNVTLTSSGGNTYLWSNTRTTSTITIAPNDTTIYFVTVTDVLSCTDVDTAVVYAKTRPNVVAGADFSVVIGAISQLTATVTGGTGQYSYLWTPKALLQMDTVIYPNTINMTASTSFTIVATDKVTGCSGTATQGVTVTGIPLSVVISLSASDQGDNVSLTTCQSAEVTLYARARGGTGIYNYVWTTDPPLATGNYVVKNDSIMSIPKIGDAGIYKIMVNDGNTSYGDSIVIVVNPQPDPKLTVDNDSIAKGDQITLSIDRNSGKTYIWSVPGYNNRSSITIKPELKNDDDDFITYKVTVTNSETCSKTDTINIYVFDYQVWVPESFTPNSDNINSTLCVRGVGLKEIDFKLYNRWGELVFHTNDPRFCWDGTYNDKIQHLQTFGWIAVGKYSNDRTFNKTGSVTLLK